VSSRPPDFLRFSDFWIWRGTVGRAKYAALGVSLFAIKHLIDRVIALSFGYQFTIFGYWVETEYGIQKISQTKAAFFACLVLVALPFIWIGVVLTLRRLRDAGLPLWLVVLFFVPFVNLLFFVSLTFFPSSGRALQEAGGSFQRALSRTIPISNIGSAAMGVMVTAFLGVIFTLLSVNALGQYGWGLFVGIPFFLGFNSVLIYGFHAHRSIGKCLSVAVLSVMLVAAAIFIFAFEGLICLLMAAPPAIVLALFGGAAGYFVQRRYSFREAFQAFSLVVLLCPALIVVEKVVALETPACVVRTAIVINAPPEKVWQHVVSFSELRPPHEALFATGVAYPIRAQIDGTGAGATRHCVFSTGEFVEPISVWDQPRLLKFDVTSQPPVMKEWSLDKDLRTPHLENYLVSKQGQFLLTPLEGGRTLLEGTTWYENRMWPGRYWQLWSDFIIHRIHDRVLAHIKELSETPDVGNAKR
jgi:uncharacterized membrane protein YhaH (DUF805 family)